MADAGNTSATTGRASMDKRQTYLAIAVSCAAIALAVVFLWAAS